MKDHRIVPVSMNKTVFRAPAQPGHPSTGQPLANVLRKGTAQVRAPRFDPCDTTPFKHVLKAANGRFNFG